MLQGRQLFLCLKIRLCEIIFTHQLRKPAGQRINLINKAVNAVGLHQSAQGLISLDILA